MPRAVAAILTPYGKGQQDCRDANTVITEPLNQSQEPPILISHHGIENKPLLTQVTVSQEFQYFNP